MKIKTIFMLLLVSLSLQAISKDTINCIQAQGNKYNSICKQVIDLNKLSEIDCLGELEDGYSVNVCRNVINPMTNKKINCLKPLNDGVEVNFCTTAPNPSSIKSLNCLDELEDGYTVSICENVNLADQEFIKSRIKGLKF